MKNTSPIFPHFFYKPTIYLFTLLIAFFACQKEKKTTTKPLSQPTLFQLLPPEETNVHFVNTLEEGLNTNVLMYEYFYNGGGVATADFNGDGLIDIYFTSNMGENKFYLNEGNFKFKEVAQIAGIKGRSGPWKTGITHTDLNGDGKMDLYLCYSGALPNNKRINQLFINQGNNAEGVPIFEEKAAEYGLNSPAFSNQGYFFDYDKDGDLDMLLLNHNPTSLPVLNEVSTAKMLGIPDPLRGLRLFQQSNNKFYDITEKAGISGSALSYGLGIGIADFNEDGWDDFYVSNDYTIPDYLYINNQNGTFTDKIGEQLGHISHFSMGNDVADYNNDGLMDILTLDMLPEDNRRQKLLMSPDNYAKFDLNIRSGFHHQYMRNMLQLNNGDGTFSEIGQLAGIDKTDWSWSALLADYNNDGWKDLYVTNGYFRDYTNLDFIKYMDDFVAEKGRLKREDVMELINNIPSSDVVNYMFKNKGDLTFEDVTSSWGFDHIANSNGAAYADLDNDGDLDLVVNNINKPAFIFENQSNQKNNYLKVQLKGEGQNTQGIGTTIEIIINGKIQEISQFPSRGYLSSVSPILHFGIGNTTRIDSLKVRWTSGKQEILQNIEANQTLVLEEKNARPSILKPESIEPIFTKIKSPIDYKDANPFIRDFDRQALLISELSHDTPCMVKGDINGDGLGDIFIGGASGLPSRLFIALKNGQFQESTNFNEFVKADINSHDTDAAIFDANGDGFKDIYVASGGYHFFYKNDPALQDRLYLNDGKGNFSKSTDALPTMPSNTQTIAINDVNGDGFMDIFLGGGIVPGDYPETSESYLLLNDGNGKFSNQIATIAPDLQQLGHVTDAVWLDLNNDELKDLVIVGEWLPITAFINQNGTLTNQTATIFSKEYLGWWKTVAVADLNKDGQLDLVVGNQGRNIQYAASEEKPIELVYQDFDQNGSIDPFLNYYKQGKSYPDVTRDELLGQLTQLRSRYTSYKSFADATLSDIFTKTELRDAINLSANHLETSVLLSANTGKFTLAKLPIQAQFAPINAIQILDFDKDDNADILLCGNSNHLKLRLGKADANYGILLKGNGQGNFEYIHQKKSGLQLKGEVRCVIKIDNQLLFGINQQPIVAYQSK